MQLRFYFGAVLWMSTWLILVTWLQSFPAPSDTGTPPEVACGGLQAAHGMTHRQRGCRGTNEKGHLSERKDLSRDKLLILSKESGTCGLDIEDVFQEVFCFYCASLSLKLSRNSSGPRMRA